MSDSQDGLSADDRILINLLSDLDVKGQSAIADYINRYPHLARKIQKYALMDQKLVMARPPVPFPVPEQLGDFRIVRKIDQGGQGALHEAIQEALQRRVAIKTIRQDKSSEDTKLRFAREQKVLALVHHTRIVPIHAAGETDGCQYVAMQFIDGATLRHIVRTLVIRESSQPGSSQSFDVGQLANLVPPPAGAVSTAANSDCNSQEAPPQAAEESTKRGRARRVNLSRDYLRSVAEVLAEIADALHHIHQLGIVHRDVKPSNIMVDKRGQCWLIDFGLAGSPSRESQEPPPSVTSDLGPEPARSTGLLGTPHYMAPEQFDARADVRTDVWGLGATLYELLALKRPFEGTRSQLEDQIRRSDPPSPAVAVAGIAPDLLAISRKAMQRKPGDRYQSAADFAADLRRWLQGVPTQARPAWLPRRTLQWSRRHPGWATAAVLLIMAVGVLATWYVQVKNAKQETDLALAEVKTAKEETDLALADVKTERTQARHVVSGMTDIVERLSDQPHMLGAFRDFLDIALGYYVDLSKRNVKEPQDEWEAGRAYFHIGAINSQLGRHAQSRDAYCQARDIFARVPRQNGSEHERSHYLARCRNNLARVEVELGLLPSAENNYDLAIALHGDLAGTLPLMAIHRRELATSHNNAANLYKRTGRPQKAKEAFETAQRIQAALAAETPDDPAYRLERAITLMNLAQLLTVSLGKIDEAKTTCEEAIGLLERLLEANPALPAYRQQLAATYNNQGTLLKLTGNGDKADEAYRRALDIQTRLTTEYPSIPLYRLELSRTLLNLGNRHKDADRLKEAEDVYRRAVQIQEELIKQSASVPVYRHELALSLNQMGLLATKTGLRDDAVSVLRRAQTINRGLVEQFDQVPEYKQGLARCCLNLGLVLHELDRYSAAEENYDTALRLHADLAAGFAEAAEYRQDLATTNNNLGNLRYLTGKWGPADDAFRRALVLQQSLVDTYPKVPAFRLELAQTHQNLGVLLTGLERFPEAERELDNAVAAARQLVADAPKTADHVRILAVSQGSLANVKMGTGQTAEALRLFEEAIGHLTGLTGTLPKVAVFRLELSRLHLNRGNLLKDNGQVEAASSAYKLAENIQRGLIRDFPEVPEYVRELNRTLDNLGRLCTATGDAPAAARYYNTAIAQQERLVAAKPGVTVYDREMARLLCGRGSLLSAAGLAGPATADFRRCIGLLEASVSSPTGTPADRWQLACALDMLGTALKKTPASRREAEAAYRRALAILAPLTAEQPKSATYGELGAVINHNLGMLLVSENRLPDAERAFATSIKARKALLDRHEGHAAYSSNLGGTLSRLAAVVADRGDVAQARAFLEEAVGLQLPVSRSNRQDLGIRERVNYSFRELTAILARQGADDEALRRAAEYNAAFTDPLGAANYLARCVFLVVKRANSDADKRRAAVRSYVTTILRLYESPGQDAATLATSFVALGAAPGAAGPLAVTVAIPAQGTVISRMAVRYNDLAWFLATCPDDSHRDARRAVTLARTATGMLPGNATFKNTLGVALCRTGSWQEATEQLSSSLKAQPGNAHDLFFLAMAHWHLGDKERAREEYSQAIRWMNENHPDDLELLSFRDEAAALLGERVPAKP